MLESFRRIIKGVGMIFIATSAAILVVGLVYLKNYIGNFEKVKTFESKSYNIIFWNENSIGYDETSEKIYFTYQDENGQIINKSINKEKNVKILPLIEARGESPKFIRITDIIKYQNMNKNPPTTWWTTREFRYILYVPEATYEEMKSNIE